MGTPHKEARRLTPLGRERTLSGRKPGSSIPFRRTPVSDLETFEQVCRAMADPAFYPHPVSKLERRDTHISAVFLTGDFVYKLKKPIDFGFLDYTGLETRRRMCELEVGLNQRLSHGVYLGVVPLSRDGEGFHLGDSGVVVEYAVKMKQLPDEASLSQLIVSGQVGSDEMLRLGRRLAEFYAFERAQ